jgi:unsaturated chondroitin disaccharide hydrolase
METQGESEQGWFRRAHRCAALPIALTLILGTLAHADLEDTIAQQLANTATTLAPNRYPEYTNGDGTWHTTDAATWTSGFFPGAMWLMYHHTGDPAWRTEADRWQMHIPDKASAINNHEIGFITLPSFVLGHALTDDERYRTLALEAATRFASRFHAACGCLRTTFPDSPEGQVKTIIDTTVMLELLFWGSAHGGNPQWASMAHTHARRVAAEHIRSDGSTYHVIVYNATTGARLSGKTAQGYKNESTWARGQAWAIYGFTMAYRYTGDPTLLDAARRVADYWLTHLPPDDVPYWDFEAPNLTTQPRDSSAGAIAASGLLALATLDPDASRRDAYRAQADATLASLTSPAYLTAGPPFAAILQHATHNKPRGIAVDTGLIYGDYYFMEALLRQAGLPPRQPPTNPPPAPPPAPPPPPPPPQGDVILAVKAFSASAHQAGNPPKNTLDNNLNTRWSAEGDAAWIRFDLGTTKTIAGLTIAWYLGTQRRSSFAIQTSGNGSSWTTRWSGQSSGTTAQHEPYDFADVKARYVRIVGHGNTQNAWNSITEVDIYGR